MTCWHHSSLHVLSDQNKAAEIKPLKIAFKVALVILTVIVVDILWSLRVQMKVVELVTKNQIYSELN